MFRRTVTRSALIGAAAAVTSFGLMSPAAALESRTGSASLRIIYQADSATTPVVWALSCPSRKGNHPDPKGACDRLDDVAGNPFAPVPNGTMCTMVYGGPQQATITGRWRSSALRVSFNLTNGCEIGRWNNLVPVLPAAGT